MDYSGEKIKPDIYSGFQSVAVCVQSKQQMINDDVVFT